MANDILQDALDALAEDDADVRPEETTPSGPSINIIPLKEYKEQLDVRDSTRPARPQRRTGSPDVGIVLDKKSAEPQPEISLPPEGGIMSDTEIDAGESRFGRFLKKLGASVVQLPSDLARWERALAAERYHLRMQTQGPNADPIKAQQIKAEYQKRISQANALIEAMPKVEQEQIYKSGLMKYVEQGLAGTARFVPLLPMYAANPGVGWAISYGMIYGGEYERYIAQGLDHKTAANAANLSATLQSLVESAGNTIQVGALLKLLGADKVAGRYAARFVGEKVAKKLGEVSAKPFAKRFMIPLLTTATATIEGLEEVTQAEMQIIADEYAKDPTATPEELTERVIDKWTNLREQSKIVAEQFPPGFIGGLALGTAAGAAGKVGQRYLKRGEQVEETVTPEKDTKKKTKAKPKGKKRADKDRTKPAKKLTPAEENSGDIIDGNDVVTEVPESDVKNDAEIIEETPETPTFTFEGEPEGEIQGIDFTPEITDVKKAKFKQTDLVRPALRYDNGTVVEGPTLSSPWRVSKLTEKVPREISESFAKAEQESKARDLDPDEATAGWMVGKNFLPNTVVAKKIKLFEKAKKKGRKLREEILPDRYEAEMTRADKSAAEDASKLVQLRDKGTREDRVAMGLLLQNENIVNKAARSFKNATPMADPIPLGDLKQEAHARAWEIILSMDKADVKAYLDNPKKNRKLPGTVYQGIGWHLSNFSKEFRGQLTGRSRADVVKQVEEGTFKSDLPYEETATESGLEEGAEAGRSARSVLDDVGRPEEVDMAAESGEVRTISPEQYMAEQRAAQERRQAADIAALKGAREVETRLATEDTKRARKVQQMKEQVDVQKTKKTTPTKKVQETPKKTTKGKKPTPRKTPSEKLAAKAKPAKKKGVKTLEERIEKRYLLRGRMKHKWSKEALDKFDRDTEAMEEQATKPDVAVEPTAEQTQNAQRKLLKDQSGQVNIELLNKVIRGTMAGYNGVGNWFSIEHRFRKAPLVGKAMKNIFSRQEVEEERGIKDAKVFMRIVNREFQGKQTKVDLANIVLAAESSNMDNYIKKWDEDYQRKIYDAALFIREWFDQKQNLLKTRGMHVDYKKRMLAKLEKDWQEAEDFKKAVNITKRIAELERAQYIHIPVQVWTMDKLDKMIHATSPKEFKKKWAKMKTIIDKERTAVSLRSMVDKKLIDMEQINPVEIMLAYSRRLGHDFALMDIRDAAMHEGLLKVQKTKPKTKQGIWKEVPARLEALKPGDVGGKKKTWVRWDLVSFLDSSQEAVSDYGWFQRFNSIVKMTQFYNPFFLPMYDLVQHTMLTMSPATPVKSLAYLGRVPANLINSVGDVILQTPNYLEAKENGMASKPYNKPFSDWRDISDHISSRSTRMQNMINFLTDLIKQIFNIPKGSFLKPIYEASWNMAWKMDEMVRMMSYNFLRDQGHTVQDAAQTAAKFHGDYANVPATTRKTLNKFFFTPTFKIAMGQLYISMIKNLGKTIVNIPDLLPIKGRKTKTTKVQRRMAYGLLATAGINIAHHLLMTNLGFDDDELGRRYVKEYFTPQGKREVAITWSHPANMFSKYYFRTKTAFGPASDNWLRAMLDLNRWEWHPTYRTVYHMVFNVKPGGGQIYSQFDDMDVALRKLGDFALENILGLYNGVKLAAGVNTQEQVEEARRLLIKDLGGIWRFVEHFSFAYARNPKQLRVAGQLKKLQNDFNREIRERAKKGKDLDKSWLENYKRKLRKITEELK